MENPFDGLAIFVRVIDAGSLSRAASELGVTKSTVSDAIRRLEQRLGVRLLERTTRRLAPTPAGQACYERARNALAEALSAAADATALHNAPAGLLRVAAPEIFTPRHIVPLLPKFLASYPGLQIEFVEGVPAVDLIEAKIDIALRVTASPADNLIVRSLGPSPVIIVASPDYLASHRRPEHPTELAEHQTIGFSPLHWGREWRFRRSGEAVEVAVRPVVLTNTAHTQRSAALAGIGLTAIPAWMVSEELANGTLVAVLEDWEAPGGTMYAVYPSNRLLALKVKLFVDLIAARVREISTSRRVRP
jgi:DNA-binding transcriptional LysR family regulator